MPKKNKHLPPIPDFATREEMAQFWDTHDIADYWDQLQPIRVRVPKNLSEPLTIRLDPQSLAELRSRAKQMGIGPTTLARLWLLECLRAEPSIHRGGKPKGAPTAF